MLSRIYVSKHVRFDVQTMVESRGGRFIKETVASINPTNKFLILDSGAEVEYDFVSFNMKSH